MNKRVCFLFCVFLLSLRTLIGENFFTECQTKNDKEVFALFKKLTNHAFEVTLDAKKCCACRETVLKINDYKYQEIRDEEGFLKEQEAPAAAYAQKLLKEDLDSTIKNFMRDFFKTTSYQNVRKNIGDFYQLILKSPVLQKGIFDKAKLDTIYPEYCVVGPETGYIYKDNNIIGAYCRFKKTYELCKGIKLEVVGRYEYWFEMIEKRLLGLRNMDWAPYLLMRTPLSDKFLPASSFLTKDVRVAFGFVFNGMISFICDNQCMLSRIGYVFSAHDAEKVSLIEGSCPEFDPHGLSRDKIESQGIITLDNIDPKYAEYAGYITNKLIYASFGRMEQDGDESEMQNNYVSDYLRDSNNPVQLVHAQITDPYAQVNPFDELDKFLVL